MAYLEEICHWAQRVKSNMGHDLGHIIINSELKKKAFMPVPMMVEREKTLITSNQPLIT